MIASKFKIDGMTCESCVEKLSIILQSIPHVDSVKVDLSEKSATLIADQKIDLSTVTQVLTNLPKYSVSLFIENDQLINSKINKVVQSSIIKTYKPLIILFTYIFAVSICFQIYQGHFQYHLFMNHIMAGFFVGLSFFKFLDLKTFAESFSSYDPLAQKFLPYGFIYPFIELTLGLLFITSLGLLTANILTVFVLSITTFGVIKRLQSKTQIQCACLGTGFSLPLSSVTVFENVFMIFMALYNIVKITQ